MTEKERLLAQIEEKYGIPIAIPDGVDEEAAVKALTKMAGDEGEAAGSRPEPEDAKILQYLEGKQPPEEAARTEEALEREYAGIRATIYRIRLAAPTNEDVRRIIFGLAGEPSHLLKKSEKELIVIASAADIRTAEDLKERAVELADTLAADAMIGAVISVDTSINKMQELRKINAQAELAVIIGTRINPGETVYVYNELGTGKMLYRLTQEEKEEFLTDTLGSFRFAGLDQEMQMTIRTFFDADLSVTETARRLYIHRNTLIYRIDKLYKLTGLDIRRFNDAVAARLAFMVELLMGD